MPFPGCHPVTGGANFIVIAGPTGAGKSEFACALASKLGGEIVCADAFQVYEGMGILTAQPHPRLCASVPHHLYGVVPPSEPFDAAKYARLAGLKIAEIAQRGRRVFLVGGSGLYLRALFGGLDEAPAADPVLRESLAQKSLEELIAQLAHADPSAADIVDTKNPRRVARALEIVLQTGRPLSASRKQSETSSGRFGGFLLTREPDDLKARIASNVESMFESGVLSEVMALQNVGVTASRAIGFQQIQRYAMGELSKEEAMTEIIKLTRQYAKRQLTWFRNQTTCQTLLWSKSRPLPDLIEEAVSAIANLRNSSFVNSALQRSSAIFFAALMLLVSPGCASKPADSPQPPPRGETAIYSPKPWFTEHGIASWYGGRWIGRLTANGERYRAGDITAAHKKLPFNTIVRVTDLKTGKQVTVRINNRGPFIKGRIIDLSVVAAKKLGMYHRGLAKVKIEALREIPQIKKPNLHKPKVKPSPSPKPAPPSKPKASAKPTPKPRD